MITVSIAVDDDDNLYLYRVPFTCRPMYGGLAFAGWCCASQPASRVSSTDMPQLLMRWMPNTRTVEELHFRARAPAP